LKFRKKDQKLNRNDYGIQASKLTKHLSNGGDIPQEMMEALIEAEQLNLLYESTRVKKRKKMVWNDETEKYDIVEEEVIDDANKEDDFIKEVEGGEVFVKMNNNLVNIDDIKKKNVDKLVNDEVNNNDIYNNYKQYQMFNGAKIISLLNSKVSMFVPGQGIKDFHFGHIFNQDSTQNDIYDTYARNSVIDALNGFNSCIMCYGQTGSGKTYTMFGSQHVLEDIIRDYKLYGDLTRRTKDQCGVVIRSIDEILKFKNNTKINVSLSCQYIQI